MGFQKKTKMVAPLFQAIGSVATINSQAITVTARNAAGLVTECYGTVTITDAGAGYAKGCRYVKTDGGVATTTYINEGTTSACIFTAMQSTIAVSLTNAEMLALRATPKTLVAAPGAGYLLEFISAVLLFDYTAAYTETNANMAVKYTNGSGVQVSDTIESTGFVDATADTITFARKAVDGIVAKTGGENQALVLHNLGAGEFGGGNAANVVRVKVSYRVHATGF